MSPQSRGSGHPTHASQVPKWILAGHLSDESLKQEDGVSSHGSLRGGLRGSGMRSRKLGYGYGGSEIVFLPRPQHFWAAYWPEFDKKVVAWTVKFVKIVEYVLSRVVTVNFLPALPHAGKNLAKVNF